MDPITTLYPWVLYETPDASSENADWNLALRSLWQCATATTVGAITLLLAPSSLQAKTFPDAGRVYIAPSTDNNVNIRSGPGIEYRVVNTLSSGTAIDINGRYENGWAQLNSGNWVAGFLINSHPLRDFGTVTSGTVISGVVANAYINTPVGYNLNIRQGPGIQYAAVNTLARNTAITVSGRSQNGWLQLTDGSWAAGNWIQVTQPVTQRPTTPASSSSTNDLKFGSRGTRVTDLQRRLQTLGYLPSNAAPDGVFAQNTESAVIRFQQNNGLVTDGVAGSRTLQVLYSDAARRELATTPPVASQPPPPVQPSPSPTPETPPTSPARGSFREAQVVADDGGDVLIFSGPGTEHELITFLPSGTAVNVTEQADGNWTRLENGGWVYTDRLRFF